MKHLSLWFALVLALVALIPESSRADADAGAAWQQAHVALPAGLLGGKAILGHWSDRQIQRAVRGISQASQAPALIFMHGCDGIGFEEESWKLFFMDRGYPSFFPNSFARIGRRANCSPAHHSTALFPEAHAFRLEELHYAVRQVSALPWVDENRIFVIGFSEGGMAAAGYDGRGVAGIVIMGWHCHGLEPYAG